MVTAYHVRRGRPRQAATSLILRGSHRRYICDHAGIPRCYPVRIIYVRIADRPRGRFPGLELESGFDCYTHPQYQRRRD